MNSTARIRPDRSTTWPLVRVLGRFQVELGGVTLAFPLQAQRVIAYLSVTGVGERRDRLAGRLWPFSAQSRAEASLRTALWRIGATSSQLVTVSRSHVSLHPDVEVDARAVCDEARALVDGSNDSMDAGRSPWEQELLPGWDEEWLTIERERVRQLRIHGLEAFSRNCVNAGRHLDAIDAALTAVALEPLRESAHIVLMEAYLAEGNASEAHRQLATYRSLLQRELGIAPSHRIIRLVEAPPTAALAERRRGDDRGDSGGHRLG